MVSQTWLITGCSSGFGNDLVLAALKRGDKVVATARGPVARLKTLEDAGAHVVSLDVTAPLADIKNTIGDIVKEHGQIDVLVNNAGYVEIAIIEEASEETWKRQFDTNFFGTVKMTQAVLPYMRTQRSGTIVTIGSMMGWQSIAATSPYASSKYALEAFHESLSPEVEPFGIRSLLFEPGMFRTNVLTPKNLRWEKSAPIEDHDSVRNAAEAYRQSQDGVQVGDSKKGMEIIVDVVKNEGVAKGKLMEDGRLPLGSDALEAFRTKCHRTLKMLDEWENVIVSTSYEDTDAPSVK